MPLIDAIVQNSPEFVAFRRDLHAHPELAFEEVRTAQLVADKLAAWGIDVHRGLAGTGVVGVLRGNHGDSQAVIGLRADMDALPIHERNTFAHASTTAGKMHACGHDGHTAMLLAAAQYLSQQRDFAGYVVFIFQPAEEAGGGAQRMLQDGLFERFGVQEVFGLHNWPGLAVGTFAASSGPVMASNNDFQVTVRGKGGHAAIPHEALDPLPVACQLVQAWQNIISRNLKPIDAAVISVTMMHAGCSNNVIPDSCELQGTVRTFSTAVLDTIEARMRQTSQQLCAAFDLQADFALERNYPPTINAAGPTQFCRQVLQDMVGPAQVLAQEPTMGAEDFSYMLQQRPGCYAFIGNGDGSHRASGFGAGPCVLHNASYDFNDALLPLGASYWVQLAQSWLAAQQ